MRKRFLISVAFILLFSFSGCNDTKNIEKNENTIIDSQDETMHVESESSDDTTEIKTNGGNHSDYHSNHHDDEHH